MSAPDITRSQAAEDGRLALPVKLFLLSIFIPVAFQLGPLSLNGVRVILLVVTIPLFFKLLAGHYGKLLLVDFLFLAHVVWMALSLAVNNPDQMVEQAGSVGMEFLGGYLMGRAFIRTRQQFLTLCRVVTLGILLLLPLSLFETQTGRSLILESLNRLPGITTFAALDTDMRLGLERVQGPLPHPIHFGLFCSIMVPVAFFAFRHCMSDTRRIILTALVFLSGLLGLSAGVLLALVAQVGLISWYLVMRRVERKWLILTSLVVAMYVTVDILSTRDPVRVFIHYATFSAHTGYWRMIIFEWGWMNIFGSAEKGIPPAPLFGIGMDDWVRPAFMYSGSMDNFWLLIGVRYGVPAVLTLAAGYFWTLWKVGRRTDLDTDEELLDIRRGWIFVFVGLTLTLITVHIWATLYAYVFFFFGAGIWLLSAQPRGTKAEAEKPEQAVMETRRYSRFPVHPVPYPAAHAASRPHPVSAS